jgi:putative tryptophan/tyrosine transport system substrate-binding protein
VIPEGGPPVSGMGRREFVALFGGAAAAWPVAVRGQPAKLPTIGFLGVSSAAAIAGWLPAFVQRLRELG